MSGDAPIERYTRAARWLHWLTFAFVALAYLLINLRGLAARGSDARTLVMQGHMLTGLIVLVLVLPRLLHRFGNAPPPIAPPIATWERVLSRLTHVVLYGFLVFQPVLGLATAFLAGRHVIIPFTAVEIPSPLKVNHDLSEQLANLHGWIGTVFYFVIGLHILAALWHHFVRRDNTLQRMAG